MLEPIETPANSGVNAGLPPLDLSQKPYSWFEFLPPWLVYLPVVAYWIILSLRYRNFGLPMLANPNIELGGMVGESKSDILNQAGDHAKQFILPWVSYLKTEDLVHVQLPSVQALLTDAELEYPIVAKPDLGCRGQGVQKCDDVAALQQYLDKFPVGRRVILQKLAPWGAEAGVFYVRWPHSKKGSVVSLTLKYRATLTGDGTRSLRQLIDEDTRARRLKHIYFENNEASLDEVPAADSEVALGFLGSHCQGSIFRDGRDWITPALSEAIDAVMQDFPSFYYGRLDIKFANTDTLAKGREFCILEVNGVSSEQTHIWDARTRFRDAMHVLFTQYKTLFAIGNELRARGLKPPSVRQMIKIWIRELREAA